MSKSSFITPPPPGPQGNYNDNPTYQEGRKIKFEWKSDIEFTFLRLFQEYPPDGQDRLRYRNLNFNTTEKSFIWTVSLEQDTSKGADSITKEVPQGEDAIFYLSLHSGVFTPYQAATSHFFNVTVGRPIPPSGASNSISTSTAVNIMTTSATNTPTAGADGNDSGLSSGATAGIATGASVGGMLALGALGFLVWRHLRKRKQTVNELTVAAGPEMTKYVPELAAYLHQPVEEDPQTQKYAPQPIYEAP